jgi:ArsR family transcriptional regulator, arsenate/arsenite/antimonite-responsive transcriptional repressor
LTKVDALIIADVSTLVNVLRQQCGNNVVTTRGRGMARPRTTTVTAPTECCASVLQAPLGERDAEELSRAFAALADPVRLRLLSLIATADEVCSCELEQPLGRSQPTISHHTRALAEAGLITGEKRGRWMYWRVVPERVAAVRSALE